jgi:PhoPQ-activated pathogenicity-related protein
MRGAIDGGSIATKLHLESIVAHSRRPFFALILSLLLLGVQVEAQLHALSHVREALGHSRDHSLLAPSDAACAECMLLAGSANAIAGDIDQATVTLAAQEHALSAPASVTPAFSSYYQTRAPPALL